MYRAASKIRGFFPIRYAQGQNDNIILHYSNPENALVPLLFNPDLIVRVGPYLVCQLFKFIYYFVFCCLTRFWRVEGLDNMG